MDFQELIRERRSVRGYLAKTVPHDVIMQVLKEAQQAPSWKDFQPARCYVAESPAMIAKLSEEGLPSFNRKSSEHAALIVTTYVRDLSGYTDGMPDNEVGNGWGAYDLGLHDAYLVLAAKNAGLDTLIMGIRDETAIRKSLSIPEEETIMSVIALGYRDEEKKVIIRSRKELEEVTKYF